MPGLFTIISFLNNNKDYCDSGTNSNVGPDVGVVGGGELSAALLSPAETTHKFVRLISEVEINSDFRLSESADQSFLSSADVKCLPQSELTAIEKANAPTSVRKQHGGGVAGCAVTF